METSSELQQVTLKERIKLILKFALVALVFWFLFRKGLLTKESFERLFASPLAVLGCILLMCGGTILGAFRWQLLLRTQGADLAFWRIIKLNLIGVFFNIALPGAISGDFVKAIYVAKQFKDKRAAVFGSMLFDRILGVAAMVFVASFSAILSTFLPWGGSLPPTLLISVGAAGGGTVLFFIYLFVSHNRDPLFSVLQFFTRRSEKLGALDRLYLGVMNYRHHPRQIMKVVSISIVIHIMIIFIMFLVTEAISDQPLPFIALAVTVPIGLLATAIPVLPAGVGTGHAAFYALFKFIGSPLGAEVFSIYVLFQVLFGIVGGMIYLRLSTEK